MRNETKERIKAGLKFLFIPITGFNFLLKECKNDSYENFYTEWLLYILRVIVWCACIAIISIIIWGLTYNFAAAIIPVSIVVGGIFVFFILPVIIHKLIHRK